MTLRTRRGPSNSSVVDLPGSAIAGFERSFLSPGHGCGVRSSEMNSPKRASDLGPEAPELPRTVRGTLAHSGKWISGPVMYHDLLDICRFSWVKLMERLQGCCGRHSRLSASEQNAAGRIHLFGHRPYFVALGIGRSPLGT